MVTEQTPSVDGGYVTQLKGVEYVQYVDFVLRFLSN